MAFLFDPFLSNLSSRNSLEAVSQVALKSRMVCNFILWRQQSEGRAIHITKMKNRHSVRVSLTIHCPLIYAGRFRLAGQTKVSGHYFGAELCSRARLCFLSKFSKVCTKIIKNLKNLQEKFKFFSKCIYFCVISSVIFQKLVTDNWSDVWCMKRGSEQMSLAIFWLITLDLRVFVGNFFNNWNFLQRPQSLHKLSIIKEPIKIVLIFFTLKKKTQELFHITWDLCYIKIIF